MWVSRGEGASGMAIGQKPEKQKYVVAQFYPWFNFDFSLFFSMLIYDNEYQIKIEPRIKLNYYKYNKHYSLATRDSRGTPLSSSLNKTEQDDRWKRTAKSSVTVIMFEKYLCWFLPFSHCLCCQRPELKSEMLTVENASKHVSNYPSQRFAVPFPLPSCPVPLLLLRQLP